MTNNQQPGPPANDAPNEGGIDLSLDPGTTDLGDDVYRDAGNSGGLLDDVRPKGLEGGLDPGNTDLGPDVYRDADLE